MKTFHRSSELAGARTYEEVIAAKGKIKREDVDEISLRVLIALDSAKRAQCPASLANFLTKHLVMAVAIGSQMRNKSFYDLSMKAYTALFKASNRDTILLDLTTGEYATIRRAVGYYVNHLPHVELGLFNFASQHAQKVLSQEAA